MAQLNCRQFIPGESTEHEAPASIYLATKVLNEKCLDSASLIHFLTIDCTILDTLFLLAFQKQGHLVAQELMVR